MVAMLVEEDELFGCPRPVDEAYSRSQCDFRTGTGIGSNVSEVHRDERTERGDNQVATCQQSN